MHVGHISLVLWYLEDIIQQIIQIKFDQTLPQTISALVDMNQNQLEPKPSRPQINTDGSCFPKIHSKTDSLTDTCILVVLWHIWTAEKSIQF